MKPWLQRRDNCRLGAQRGVYLPYLSFVSSDLEGAQEFANAKFQKLSDIYLCIGSFASKDGDGTHTTPYRHNAFDCNREMLFPRRRSLNGVPCDGSRCWRLDQEWLRPCVRSYRRILPLQGGFEPLGWECVAKELSSKTVNTHECIHLTRSDASSLESP